MASRSRKDLRRGGEGGLTEIKGSDDGAVGRFGACNVFDSEGGLFATVLNGGMMANRLNSRVSSMKEKSGS